MQSAYPVAIGLGAGSTGALDNSVVISARDRLRVHKVLNQLPVLPQAGGDESLWWGDRLDATDGPALGASHGDDRPRRPDERRPGVRRAHRLATSARFGTQMDATRSADADHASPAPPGPRTTRTNMPRVEYRAIRSRDLQRSRDASRTRSQASVNVETYGGRPLSPGSQALARRERRLQEQLTALQIRNSELDVRYLSLKAGATDLGESKFIRDAELMRLKEQAAKLERSTSNINSERERAIEALAAAKANRDVAQRDLLVLKRTNQDAAKKEAERASMLTTEKQQMGLVRQVLDGTLDRGMFTTQLLKVPREVRHEWLQLLAVHLKRLGKLLSLNEVVTQSLKGMETAMDMITKEACNLLNAERATVFAADFRSDELYSIVAGGDGTPFEIRIPFDAGIAGHVFQNGETLNIPDAYDDDRFNQEVDKKSGLRTKAILCVPIQAHAGYKMGVLQVMNRKDGGEFDEDDQAHLEGLAIRVGIHLLHAETYEDVKLTQNNNSLLSSVMSAFLEEVKIAKAMDIIVEDVTDLLGCERASVFLADADSKTLFSRSARQTAEIRFPWHMGIAGECYMSAKPINITNAYEDSRFNPDVDRRTGFRTRNILCLPIFNAEARQIGVIQAINKGMDDEDVFTEEDIFYLKRTATQAAFNLEYSRLYERALKK